MKKVVPGGETTVFVYDAGSKLIGAYSSVVQTGSNAKTVYTTNDHLGSPRINTDATGQVISRHDYHPFGEEIARTGYGSDTIRKQFTGYERDRETGLDYAQARYFASGYGRFRSPDEPFLDQWTGDPQSWNLYSYVRNNPVNSIDPSGQTTCPAFATCWTDELGNVWYKDPSTGEDTLYVGAADSGVADPSGSIKQPDGSRTMTNDEATNQQRERRNQFLLNNILGGLGHGIGSLFKRLGGVNWGFNPFKSAPKTAPSVAASATAVAMPQFSASTVAEAVKRTMKQKGAHIFRNKLHPKPHVNQLAQQVGGEERLVKNIFQNLNGNMPASGQFELTTVVNGVSLTVRGFVKDGVPVINTMF